MYFYLKNSINKSTYLNISDYKYYSKHKIYTINCIKIKTLFKYYFLFILFFIYLLYLIPNSLKIFKQYYSGIKIEGKNLEQYFYLCNNGTLINKKKFKKIENPKISIISSIYNREKYILRFIRSIQNQYFDDIEIILVDDSSRDNSAKLIEEFQKEDERIILIKHKTNKGTLISRNDGILFSKGEYLIIPDIDDILSENILYNCYESAKLNNYEMVRFYIYLGNGHLLFENIIDNIESEKILYPRLSTYIYYGLGSLEQIDYNLSNKFIKREAYMRALCSISQFYLKQYMTLLEDGLMDFILYRTIKSFFFLKKIGYYYWQNNQSITIKPTENYNLKARFIFIHWKFIFENTKNNKYEKDMVNSNINKLYSMLNKDFYLITKDFTFYYNIINIFLNSKFINESNKSLLKRLKKILNKKNKKYNL